MQFLREHFGRWARAYGRLREPKTREALRLDEEAVRRALEASPIPLRETPIDPAAWRDFVARAEYDSRHPDYYRDNLAEKSLEHYFVAEQLGLRPGAVYIDIAAQSGVAAEIYGRLHGVKTYRQDLDFPAGLNGDTIGGDAAAMPVPDGFADAMGLHCSLEHFEGDADTRFVRECARVLKPGGRVVSAPLYLCDHYACVTNPLESAGHVNFEPDMRLYAMRTWNNRHGRFYDVPHLVERLWNARGPLRMEVLVIPNFRDADPSCYLRYALMLEQKKTDQSTDGTDEHREGKNA